MAYDEQFPFRHETLSSSRLVCIAGRGRKGRPQHARRHGPATLNLSHRVFFTYLLQPGCGRGGGPQHARHHRAAAVGGPLGAALGRRRLPVREHRLRAVLLLQARSRKLKKKTHVTCGYRSVTKPEMNPVREHTGFELSCYSRRVPESKIPCWTTWHALKYGRMQGHHCMHLSTLHLQVVQRCSIMHSFERVTGDLMSRLVTWQGPAVRGPDGARDAAAGRRRRRMAFIPD